MIFFQPEGIGRLSINDRSLIQDDSGTALLRYWWGSQRYDYIATNNGVQHRDHLVASDVSLYFIDKNRRAFIFYQMMVLLIYLNLKGCPAICTTLK